MNHDPIAEKKSVEPRPASTCILLRENQNGLELFLTRRLPEMKFVGGHHVFPGGKVEAEDEANSAFVHSFGQSIKALQDPFENQISQGRAQGYWLAALRELFEEAGVLLAYDADGRCVHQSAPESLQPLREDLLADEIDWYKTLEERGWKLDLSRMRYFDHWITPPYVPIRFDTRFFITPLPEGAKASHWPGEADEGFWITPAEALRRWEEKELQMIPPTFMSIRRLMDMGSLDQIFSAK